ncbi:hypothetical protein L7F22_037822 [Adiantum nelumboides]|nr:hypothetical protein [Adiantum nelumboides]
MEGAHGNDVELISRTLQVEHKIFYFDLKKNPSGWYLKISEKASGSRSTIIVPASGIRTFVDLFQYYVTGETPLESSEVQVNTKVFYFDVGENQRGRFLKVSEVTRNRSTIIVPAGNGDGEGWASFRDILADINEGLHSLAPDENTSADFQRQGQKRHFTGKTFDERRALREAKKCYICEEEGHFANECPQRDSQDKDDKSDRKGKRPKPSAELVRDLMGDQQNVDAIELCRAWEKVRDQEVLVFFDPGARANFISPELASKLGILAEELGMTSEADLACPGHSGPVTPILGKLCLHVVGEPASEHTTHSAGKSQKAALRSSVEEGSTSQGHETSGVSSKIIRVDQKKFYFDLGSNARGQYLRISEVTGTERSAIILPVSALEQFYETVGHFVETVRNQEQPEVGSSTMRTGAPIRSWSEV